MKNTHLFKKLKDKKGLAMESAVLFLVITFAFCSIIMTLALLGRSQSKIQQIYLEEDRERAYIAGDFMTYIKNIEVVKPETGNPADSPQVLDGEEQPQPIPDPELTGITDFDIYLSSNISDVPRYQQYYLTNGMDAHKFDVLDTTEVNIDESDETLRIATFTLTVFRANTSIPVLHMVVEKNSNGNVNIITCNKPALPQ